MVAELTRELEAARELASRTAAALKQQQVLFEKAQEVAHVGSWVAELDGAEQLSWSKEMFRILDASDEDVPATRTVAMNRYVHPDDRDALRTARQAAMASGRTLEIDHRIVTPRGAVRWVHTRADVVAGPDGKLVRMVGTMQDITERRELEERLRQSQKLEAIGRLAGGVAHDLNNALTVVIGYAELAAAALEDGDALRQDIDQIRRAAERAESITRQLLAFSRRQWLEPRIFHVGEAVRELGQMLTRLAGPGVDVRLNVGADLPRIYGDRGQIEQTIVNLVVNAKDAMPEGGTVTLTVSAVDVDESLSRVRPPLAPGRYVEIAVADTGQGMPTDVLARIFEPFFTTKEVGHGGLGLAMVYGTVKQSGGYIFVDSEPGHGSVFRMYFPPTPENPPARDLSVGRPAPVHGITVLVVEDDPAVRNLVTAALRRDGYRVLEAESGRAALGVAAQAEHIDVLLTDMVMPEMTGVQLADVLLQSRTNMRVLVMSGQAYSLRALTTADRPFEFLAKPFTALELRQRMYAVLADATKEPD